MKLIFAGLIALLSASVYAANPTFESFDTNAFIANKSANSISANSSSGNPNALVIQSQITSGGISETTATNIAIAVSANNSIANTNGYGTNAVLENLTITNNVMITGSGAPSVNQLLQLASVSHRLFGLGNGTGFLLNNGSGGLGLTYSLILPAGSSGENLTNLLHLAKLSAGANITVTPAKDPASFQTNWTIAVSDPASLGQLNAGTLLATNFVTTTNNFGGGSTIYFTNMEDTVTLGGNLTISAVSGLTSGAYNHKIIHIFAGGSDRTITYPTTWGQGLGDTLVATNGDQTDILISCQPGVFTNLLQRTIIPHP